MSRNDVYVTKKEEWYWWNLYVIPIQKKNSDPTTYVRSLKLVVVSLRDSLTLLSFERWNIKDLGKV